MSFGGSVSIAAVYPDTPVTDQVIHLRGIVPGALNNSATVRLRYPMSQYNTGVFVSRHDCLSVAFDRQDWRHWADPVREMDVDVTVGGLFQKVDNLRGWGIGFSPPRWETCQILKYEHQARGVISDKAIFEFWAEGVGPKGRFKAATTGRVKLPSDTLGVPYQSQAMPVIDKLIAQLTADGWEPLPGKETWWGYRFHRRAK